MQANSLMAKVLAGSMALVSLTASVTPILAEEKSLEVFLETRLESE